MSEPVVAVLAVLNLLVVAWASGDVVLQRTFKIALSPALSVLTALHLGLGMVGLATASGGAVLGFSATVIRTIFIGLSPFALGWMAFRVSRFRFKPLERESRIFYVLCLAVFSLFTYHATFFVLSGLSYPQGSDSFTYLAVARTFLATHSYAHPTLEPLNNEIMPFFNVPCLVEMLHVGLLAHSNLMVSPLMAHLLVPFSMLTIFLVAVRISSKWVGLAVLTALLIQPMLLYFFLESLDNYWIAVSFQVLSLYFIWLSAESDDRRHVALAGIFAGLMFAAKPTTVYYLIATLLCFPLLMLFRRWAQRADQPGPRHSNSITHGLLWLWIPALAVSAVFPVIILLKAGVFPFGMEVLQPYFGLPRYVGWYQRFMAIWASNPYLNYPAEFAQHPWLSSWPRLAPILHLAQGFINNPFQTALGGSVTPNNWSPVALAAYAGSLGAIGFCRHNRLYPYAWAAIVIWIAYGLKLALYPHLNPPKSEVFQLAPALLVLAGLLAVVKVRRVVAASALGVLISMGVANAMRVNADYVATVRRFTLAPFNELASSFGQLWYNESLNERDIVFGRGLGTATYITRARGTQFFWVSLFYVDWAVVEKRIRDLGVTVVYDEVPPYNAYFSGAGVALLEKHDPALYREVRSLESRYQANLLRKQEFLARYFDSQTVDDRGTIYFNKR